MLALIGEITGYYGVLDLGMRTAVSYYVARGVAKGDVSSVDDTMHNVFWLLSGAGAVVILASAGLVWAAPYWFKIEGLSVTDARTALGLMSVVFALSLPASVFSAALYGLRRLDWVNGIDILVRLGSIVLIVLLLRAGGGLVGFVMLQGGISLARWSAEAWLVRRTGLAHNLIFPVRWRREVIRDCFRYGMSNTVINTSQMVVTQLDLLVIASFIGTRWVTYFYLGRTLCTYYASLISTITLPFTTQITFLHAKGQLEEIVGVYLRVSRLVSLLSTWMMVGIVAFGRPFFALWVGNSYISGDFYNRTDVVLYLMISGFFFRMVQGMARQVLMGSRELRFLTWANVIEAVSNLGLSVWLIRGYGLAGVAAGTAIPMCFFHGILMPIYMVRKYQIGWGAYAQAVIRPVAFTIVVFGALCWYAVSRFYPQSWWQLFGLAAVVSAVYFVLAMALELTRSEVRMIVAKLTPMRLALTGK
jgi:O-antigen/teichoic acid export membrane protein